MATNKRVLRRYGPITLLRVKVGVAYTGVGDADKAFTWCKFSGLFYWDVVANIMLAPIFSTTAAVWIVGMVVPARVDMAE